MDRHLAIRNTHPTVTSINGERDAWDKDGNVVILDESAVSTEMERLQAEYDAQDYARKRAAEYPDYRDYLDAIVKGDDTQKQKYIDDCLAVKAKYPKPE